MQVLYQTPFIGQLIMELKVISLLLMDPFTLEVVVNLLASLQPEQIRQTIIPLCLVPIGPCILNPSNNFVVISFAQNESILLSTYTLEQLILISTRRRYSNRYVIALKQLYPFFFTILYITHLLFKTHVLTSLIDSKLCLVILLQFKHTSHTIVIPTFLVADLSHFRYSFRRPPFVTFPAYVHRIDPKEVLRTLAIDRLYRLLDLQLRRIIHFAFPYVKLFVSTVRIVDLRTVFKNFPANRLRRYLPLRVDLALHYRRLFRYFLSVRLFEGLPLNRMDVRIVYDELTRVYSLRAVIVRRSLCRVMGSRELFLGKEGLFKDVLKDRVVTGRFHLGVNCSWN